MSKKIEDIFRSSLENHEETYDPSAWDALNTKLNAVSETKVNTKNTNWRTWSLIAVGIAVGGYFILNQESNSTPVTKKTSNITPQPEVKDNQTIKPIKTEVKTQQQTPSLKSNTKLEKQKITITHVKPLKEIEKSISIKAENKLNEVIKETKKVLQATSKAFYCQGETETFKNENEFTIFIVHESGKSYLIRPNEKITLNLSETGNYFWSIEDNLDTSNKMHAFEVTPINKLNFNLPSDLDYSRGLPNLNLATTNNGINKWYINGKILHQGKEIDVNLFTKGQFEIKLINESNGCKTELTKWFNTSENYNLMSVNGIEPNHPDPRRNSFIPYALILRKVEFRMIILSPTSGEIIFETSDIEKPWKGQNQKTDELVPENTEYIWKVFLTDPLKGEKSEYRGKITRI